ncbi:aspartate dehydrogenase [Pararhizobium sp.]|uniref:aspartate dehydrogenase n=1 Tax=Pararhizobium sp. TaxID=1977563 RepID=UPI0027256DE8|nr:aspartate dehydrogenase [Pararhizobium sp.]MDO9415553.1 aspartate dehydrogenase [Pararhizobium sp.]
MPLQVVTIGFGAMARSLAASLMKHGEEVHIGGALLPAEMDATSPEEIVRFTDVDQLIAARPHLVVECASHSAVRETLPKILEAGIDVILVSIGALSDSSTEQRLRAAERRGGSRLTLVSGAIGGLDMLRAANLGGLNFVIYSGTKPPQAWIGTHAEALLDLPVLTKRTMFFDGSAREAAALYPKNANVTAAVAIAGVGFDKTRVRLFADPDATENTHELEACGAFGTLNVKLMNNPLPDNPKTSWLAALSIEEAVLNHFRTKAKM